MEAGSTQSESIPSLRPSEGVYVMRRIVLRSGSGQNTVFYLVLRGGKVVKSFPGGAQVRAERYTAALNAAVVQ